MTFKYPVALLDMDGCIANYNEALERDMEKLRSPNEKVLFKCFANDNEPSYIRARMDLIRNNPSWWENLEPLLIGMSIYNILRDCNFRIVVLTQGPKVNAEAWKGKLLWCRKHLHSDVDVIITRDKSLVYGKVLVDDYPPYVESWLKHRPRGLAIMPSQPWNEKFKHKQVFKYENNPLGKSKLTDRLLTIFSDFNKNKEE